MGQVSRRHVADRDGQTVAVARLDMDAVGVGSGDGADGAVDDADLVVVA
ncbi:MAG: hypothetical protein M5T61_20480 [Acidimicrobiia bacterium]|nr:hypothetical protein [Acidimicrobiia bacterium]